MFDMAFFTIYIVIKDKSYIMLKCHIMFKWLEYDW
jgi:hypothetical protein